MRIGEGYVHVRHVAAIDIALDPVDVASSLIGMPYLWGGRGADGIDCSGLVQRAFELAGIDAPRDSDQQREALGEALPDGTPAARGDLVFFPGHVGIMLDGERLVHANAWWMRVVVEPLVDVVERLAPQHSQPVTSRRRILA
jgi:cell wall-associated NlpC family hydrolase